MTKPLDLKRRELLQLLYRYVTEGQGTRRGLNFDSLFQPGEEMTLYRGITEQAAARWYKYDWGDEGSAMWEEEWPHRDLRLDVGASSPWEHYLSTSKERSAAEKFLGDTLMVIRVSCGTPRLDVQASLYGVESTEDTGLLFPASSAGHEREVILPRGTTIRVDEEDFYAIPHKIDFKNLWKEVDPGEFNADIKRVIFCRAWK